MDAEQALTSAATSLANPVLPDTIPFPVTVHGELVRGELQGHAVLKAPKGWKDLWSSIYAKLPAIPEKKRQQLPAFKIAILANTVDFVVEKIISKFRTQPLGTVSKLIIHGVVTVITGIALQSMKTPLREFRQISSIDKQILVAGAILSFAVKTLHIVLQGGPTRLKSQSSPAGNQSSSSSDQRAPASSQQKPDSAPEEHKAAALPQPPAVTIKFLLPEPSITPQPKAVSPALSPAPSTASSAVAMTPASVASESSKGSQTSQSSTLSVDTTESASLPEAPEAPKTLTKTPNSRRQSRNSTTTPKTPKTPLPPKTPEKQAPEAPPAPEFSPRTMGGVLVPDNLEASKNVGGMSFRSLLATTQTGLKKVETRKPGSPPPLRSTDPMSTLVEEMKKRQQSLNGSRSTSPEKARKGHHRTISDDFE